jgi:hypothetical protein
MLLPLPGTKFKYYLNFGETLSASYPFNTDQNFEFSLDLECWSTFGVILPILATFVLKI